MAPLNGQAGYSASDKDEKYQCYRCNRYKGGGSACPETKRQVPGQCWRLAAICVQLFFLKMVASLGVNISQCCVFSTENEFFFGF